MVHRKNLWPSEFEATFSHRLREPGRERIVSCARLPDCHGEECGAVTNASMGDQSWRRRDWGPPVQLSRYCSAVIAGAL